jgi:hypothetical protein
LICGGSRQGNAPVLERLHGIERVDERALVVLGASADEAPRLAFRVEGERVGCPLGWVGGLDVAVCDDADSVARVAVADHDQRAQILEIEAELHRLLLEVVPHGQELGILGVFEIRRVIGGEVDQFGEGLDCRVGVGQGRVVGDLLGAG